MADIVFLCVKPRDVAGVLKEIGEEIRGKLVISTAAIVPLDFYEEAVAGIRFVRTMPNVVAFVGESFTAYCCGGGVTEGDRAIVRRLLGTMGKCEEVEEKYMDAITDLSGSGPAYVAIVIESLMYAFLKVGLPRELSLHSSAQAVLGAAMLLLDGEFTPPRSRKWSRPPGEPLSRESTSWRTGS